MKLLSKYNRVNIPVIVGFLILSSIVYYFILHFVLVHQLDNDLKIEEQEIIDFVKQKGFLPQASTYRDQQISFQPDVAKMPVQKFSTENIYDEKEREEEIFRQLVFPLIVNNKMVAATVRKSQQETEHLIQLIVAITLIVIVLLFAVIFIINRFILSELWKPFYTTLEQLKQFNISSKNKLQLNQTKITEFAELNKTALVMTDKVSSDYETLKSFTENASHEIQTPLAIIKMKLELLMQSENLSATQVDCISALSDATDRLSRLNESLLLLTKIDNSQFINNEDVDISAILLNHANNYEELASSKNILIKKSIRPGVVLHANKSLMEILISNVMTNTIKHNYENGQIEINLSDNILSVSNTGQEPSIKTHELFERFKKGNSSADSLGLGLAIVKKICETYGFPVFYNFISPLHTIEIHFTRL